MDIGLLLVRTVVGLLLAGHGAQKLFGWFGGGGVAGTARYLESIGYRPGRRHALLAGLTEVTGGLLLAIGFLMPLACAAVIGVMVNAVAAHWKKGVWSTQGGYEYALVLATVAAGLAFTGPGRAAVDHLLGWSLGGPGYGVGAVVLGVVSGVALVRMRRPEPPVVDVREPEPSERVDERETAGR